MPDHHDHFTHRRAPGNPTGRNLERTHGNGTPDVAPARRRRAMSATGAIRLDPKVWAASLTQARERMSHARDFVVEGTLSRMVGMTLEAVGCEAAVGGRCLVDTAEGRQIEAEGVGFSGEKLFLMPTGAIRGLMPGARVIP